MKKCISSSTDCELQREHVQSSTGLGGLQCRPISMESLSFEMRNFVTACLTMGLEITDRYMVQVQMYWVLLISL